MVASGSVVLNVWPVEAYCNNLGFPWAIAVVVGVFLVIVVTVPDVRGEVWGVILQSHHTRSIPSKCLDITVPSVVHCV